VDVGDAPYPDNLDLDAVRTRHDLADQLRLVRIWADNPSLRTLETRTRHSNTQLSKTVVHEMLNGVRRPSKAVMVAFLRACGVPDDKIGSWQRTWDRVASYEAGQVPRETAQIVPRRPAQAAVQYQPPADDAVTARRSWHFSDPGPITLICARLPEKETAPLANPLDPNYTELLSYADLDALIELYGHIRAENPTMEVSYEVSSKVVNDDMSSHVVILGGIGWNDKTRRLSEMTSLPIRQIEDPEIRTGEIFVLERNGSEERFLPKWEDDGTLVEDVGLIARTPNPLNSSRSLTICNGIHSRGVLGAVRSLTDARLRDSNERYIVENFADPSNFAILMRVPVISGQAMTPDFHATDCVLYQWPGA
jgi:hypothetical protein